MTLKALAGVRLADPLAERARDTHAQAITELQQQPGVGLKILGDFEVPDTGSVLVNHPLGRNPSMVVLSPPRVEFGAPILFTGGIVIDLTGPDVNRAKQVRIFATGYGIPVVVTVAVM
jgi:hypothetical protein